MNLRPHFIKVLLFVGLQLPNILFAQTFDQNLKLMIRAIGDAYLLQSKDSTTLILPISKTPQGYLMQIDQPFLFQPDVLAHAVTNVMEKTRFYDALLVETRRCDTNEEVHSFKASLSPNMELLPCKKRVDEKGCYQFYFTVIKDYEHDETPTSKTSSNNKLWWLLSIIIFVMLWVFKRQNVKPNNTANFIEIGKYQLNKTSMELIFKAQKVTLSATETDLLYLLYTNCNTTLEKGYILEAVWGDSGDYVGRTLDVYISKLRKKLALDTRIKIINVRGVGYRLVLV